MREIDDHASRMSQHGKASVIHPPYSSRQAEYWYNVMQQAKMPLAGEIEANQQISKLEPVLKELAQAKSDGRFADELQHQLLQDPEIFHGLRMLVGVMDKRAYLELSYLASRIPSKRGASLCGCAPWEMSKHPVAFFLRMLSKSDDRRAEAAIMISDFLVSEGLETAVEGFSNLGSAGLLTIYENLIEPREAQQEQAKRRGHGCEGALAAVLTRCGANILPTNKARNPMGEADPNLDKVSLEVAARKEGDTHSFDIVVLDSKGRVRVAIQSLVHTSDPGQYGVNKSAETVDIVNEFAAANEIRKNKGLPPVEIWALLDGVGFSENKPKTLNKMIDVVHHFLQLHTLYKAPLRLHQLGLLKVSAIQFSRQYTRDDVAAIVEKYVPKDVLVIADKAQAQSDWYPVTAGRAIIYTEANVDPLSFERLN